MPGYEWLTVASLLLGIAAWVLPLAALFFGNRRVLSLISFSACALSLLCVIFYLGYKVDIRDWSALMDTMRAFRLAAGSLVLGTILLNIIAGEKK
ncbi:MAG TPA: hypothetical protein VN421_11385 [Pseudoflavonifractor sp.]|nr:hypothetical protein [Pseudoflavonifractor sp.]